MGGPGSGRRRARPAVGDCRALAIGEIADGARWRGQPQGEILWRARHAVAPAARLTYTLLNQSETSARPQLLLAYRYWPAGSGRSFRAEVELIVIPGRRPVALCSDCKAAVRSLYAPPGATRFLCRRCQALSYGRSAWRERLADARAAAAPALAELAALPATPPTAAPARYVAAPPPALADRLEQELPLAEQELRLWCLRLRACGLSYRQIAPLVECSKSSVARYCAAGRAGVDSLALIRECLARAAALPPASIGPGRRGLGAEMQALHAHLKRRRLSPSAFEPEERVVLPMDAAAEL